jgi:hypothetical protein
MVAWSTTDKSNITLSGSNLTATKSAATIGGVRCDTSFAGGKLYYEAWVVVGTNHWAVGWANASEVFTNLIGNVANNNSVGGWPQRGEVHFNAVQTNMQTDQGLNNVYTVRVAVDFTAKLIWFALNDSFWNLSPTDNPATGAGGRSISTINAGPYFPIFGSDDAGSSCTARFGAADMWYPTPAGFSTLDTNTQAFMATSKFEGAAILAPPQLAANVSKLEASAILAPPQTALNISKLIAYAILQDTKPPPRSRSRENVYLRF